MRSRLHKIGITFAYNEVMVCGSICHVFKFRDYVSMDVLVELFKDIWFQALSFSAEGRLFMYIEKKNNQNVEICGGTLAEAVRARGVLGVNPKQTEQPRSLEG